MTSKPMQCPACGMTIQIGHPNCLHCGWEPPKPKCPFYRGEKVMSQLGAGYIDAQTPEGDQYLLMYKREDFTEQDWVATFEASPGSKFLFKMVPAKSVTAITDKTELQAVSTRTNLDGPIEVGQRYTSARSSHEYTVMDIDEDRGIKIKNTKSSDQWWTTEKSIRTNYYLLV